MMSDYAKALGEVVYRERKAQKITQAQLAELVGTTEQTIRKIEHGTSNLQMSVLFPLLRALHILITFFIINSFLYVAVLVATLIFVFVFGFLLFPSL